MLCLTIAACTSRPQATASPPSPLSSPAVGRPDIVLIVTDDQRWDTLRFMPTVQHELAERGTTFRNAFVVNSLCCPSRASILTGNYSHTTGVYTISPPYGGFPAFDPSSTLATWLSDAGYHTGLVGKYLNHYRGTSVPPGWDEWVAFSGPYDYYGYELNSNGALEHRGSRPTDYSTTELGSEARTFIERAPPSDPLFLYFAPFAPHAPAIPAPQYHRALPHLPEFRPPNYNEADVSDKPAWLRSFPALSPFEQAQVDDLRRQQLQTLLSADDAIRGIISALRATGRLENTVLMFTSDNGFAWGEHRWRNKLVPYEESIRVPLVVRYDGARRIGKDDHLVTNIDIAPTIADWAGVSTPPTDGRSLVPLIDGDDVRWRSAFLIEHLFDVRAEGRKTSPPTYCALRSKRFLLVRYATGETELYDLKLDPYELANIADSRLSSRRQAVLGQRLRAMCSPRPPGMPPLP
jgi:N-acetylglucosamine-6-sulfatase